jgi:cell division septation protein DedD
MNQTNGNSDTIVAAFPTMDKVAIKPAKPATVQQVATPAKNEAEKPVPAKAEPAKAIEAEEIPAQVENARFAIVLATYVSQDNAEKFIKDLAKEGLSEGRYVKNGKVSRVLYSEYADESAAQQALNKLRQQNAAFAEAWILEL